MGLRGKIAVMFVALLVAAILAVSALEISHVTRVMVSDLRDSGSILIKQTFEQIKPQLQRPNPYQELRSDITLHEFLDSSQAFGHGVVYLRMEDPAGTILAPVPPPREGQKATQATTSAENVNPLSSQQKTARQKWEKGRGQFFNIFRSITDAVILLDAEGRVLSAKPGAQPRLKLPAGGGADGKPLALLLGHEHPLARMVETSYAVGTEVHDVALELREDGATSRFLVSIFSLGRGPGPPGLLVIVRDLKPVQELESVVDYSGRLARLGGLISGVAHQIRNPPTPITFQLALLSQSTQRPEPLDQLSHPVPKQIRRPHPTVAPRL